MEGVSFTKERLLKLYARVNETGVPKVLSFFDVDADGVRTAHDITDLDFKLIVKKQSGSPTNLFALTIGSGLTVQGASSNELLIEVSEDNATQKPCTAFYQLFSIDENKTWLDGPFFFHDGEFDGVEETDEILIGDDGEIVIEISSDHATVTAATQAEVNAETVTDEYVSPATLAAKALKTGTYSTELTFDTDKDIYQDLTGLSPTFTLAASGNINGKGIFLRLNKPTAVTFPVDGTFEELTGDAFDATKQNVYFLMFFSNWNGAGLDHVVWIRKTCTAN